MEVEQEITELHGMVLDGLLFRRGDQGVVLTPRQAELLRWFMKHPNRIWKTALVQRAVWGEHYERSCLNQHLHALRQRIEIDAANPQIIRTIGHGAGTAYVLATSDDEWMMNFVKGYGPRGKKL